VHDGILLARPEAGPDKMQTKTRAGRPRHTAAVDLPWAGAGRAVQRNRIKRRLREAVRMTLPAAGVAADVVINPKKSLLAADFADVVNEVKRRSE